VSGGLLREDSDKYFTFTLQVTVNGDTASFDLVVRYPTAVKGLKTEITESNRRSARSVTGTAATMHLTVLHSFWH
jgi:hypothetical protein